MGDAKKRMEPYMDALAELMRIARLQKEAARKGAMEEFFTLAARREALQDSVDEMRGSLDLQGDAQREKALREKVEKMLLKLQETDRETRAFLEKGREQVSAELRHVRRGREALKGYGRRRQGEHLFKIRG